MIFAHDFPDFTAHVPASTLARFLAHHALHQMIQGVPGCIIDIGVGCGGSTFAWARLCRISKAIREIHGFDTFSGFPSISPEDGCGRYSRVGQMNFGETAADHLQYPVNDGLPINLFKGDIVETVPEFVRHRPDLKVALLNLDADLYAPTKAALTTLLPYVQKGGIIVVDEYDLPEFPGERQAVDEVFTEHYGKPPFVHRFPWCNNPSGYIVI